MLSFYSLASKSWKNDAETFAKGVASIVNKNSNIIKTGILEHNDCAVAFQVSMCFRLNS